MSCSCTAFLDISFIVFIYNKRPSRSKASAISPTHDVQSPVQRVALHEVDRQLKHLDLGELISFRANCSLVRSVKLHFLRAGVAKLTYASSCDPLGRSDM